jgi:hypothetical protein
MLTKPEAIDTALRKANIPIDGIGYDSQGNIRIDYKTTATDNDKANAAVVIASLDLTDAGLTSAGLSRKHDEATALASGMEPREVLLRAILKVIQAAFAADRNYLASLASEVTRLGGKLPVPPVVRSFDDIVNAVKNSIAQGSGDA